MVRDSVRMSEAAKLSQVNSALVLRVIRTDKKKKKNFDVAEIHVRI